MWRWEEDHLDALCYKKKEVGELTAAAKVLWTELPLMTIQTGTELDSAIVSISRCRAGKIPTMRPFAVIPEELGGLFENGNTHERMHIQKIEKAGMLVTDFTAEKENIYIQDMGFWRRERRGFV